MMSHLLGRYVCEFAPSNYHMTLSTYKGSRQYEHEQKAWAAQISIATGTSYPSTQRVEYLPRNNKSLVNLE